jgi:hypothetical protein
VGRDNEAEEVESRVQFASVTRRSHKRGGLWALLVGTSSAFLLSIGSKLVVLEIGLIHLKPLGGWLFSLSVLFISFYFKTELL